LLVENSWITSSPLRVVPYANFFVGWDRPQSVARAGVSGGILRNTGINFEIDGLNGYPTLDATASDTAGGSSENRMRILPLVRRGTHQGEPGERWPMCRPSFLQRLVGNARVAAIDQALPERVARKSGLDQHLADAALATRASGHLYHRLGKAFVAAEVGAKQALVRVDDADQRELREVMTLGEHLCADEDVGLAQSRLFENGIHCTAPLCAVAVDTEDGPPGKAPSKGVLQALGALAERPHRLAAFGA